MARPSYPVLVPVAMMFIAYGRIGLLQWRGPMAVVVRLPYRIQGPVLTLAVMVVGMGTFMRRLLMNVHMLVMPGDMKPHGVTRGYRDV